MSAQTKAVSPSEGISLLWIRLITIMETSDYVKSIFTLLATWEDCRKRQSPHPTPEGQEQLTLIKKAIFEAFEQSEPLEVRPKRSSAETACCKALTKTVLGIWSETRDQECSAILFAAIYGELRRIAKTLYGARYANLRTLSPTAIVNESFQRFIKADLSQKDFPNIESLRNYIVTTMRNLIRDHIKVKMNRTRLMPTNNDWPNETTQLEELTSDIGAYIDVAQQYEIEDALSRLSEIDSEAAYIFELRAQLGLTIDSIAEEVEKSPAHVKRKYRLAQIFLSHYFSGSQDQLVGSNGKADAIE